MPFLFKACDAQVAVVAAQEEGRSGIWQRGGQGSGVKMKQKRGESLVASVSISVAKPGGEVHAQSPGT